MARRWTFALRPQWLTLHGLVVAAGVTMVLLGRWQWHVAQHRHGAIQNYAYALQWWAFTGFAVVMWVRVLRDAHHAQPVGVDPVVAKSPEPVAYRRYVMPQSASSTPSSDEPVDAEHAAYNSYLAGLADPERKSQ